MDNQKLGLTIVIPVYNSEDSLSRLTDHLVNSLSGDYKLEIILVNDCSNDNSEKICIALYEKYNSIVKFYSLSKNVGEHNAVMAGLNYTTGDFIVIMDDDFQNPISEVIKLVEYAKEQSYDVVYTYYDRKQHHFLRNLGSKFNDKVANVMLKKPKDLYLSSFKLISKFLVKEIIKYDLPFPYIDGLILRTTNNIGKIQVHHQERNVGKSGYTLTKLVSLWLNMFTNFSILPLRISIYLGFVFALLGLALGVYSVLEKLSNPALPVGFAALAVSVFIFAGVQLISLGMIGEYIGRIFLSQNKRPQFTIKRKFE
ncbi:MAG: glycosyl transferase family 2 [Ignavibacteria bacterium RIFOXYC2_FULL_35_16]|nr:MAG: glycosyl transferase family 2 [Ignavibacteria bacterium GWC2_35_8]OGU61347.1 MAG: glycosyl transferase family 2 [Ignavibacteria bacterium GWF2_35_20]OGU88441.1 MAG: glycosyl transferase family 2 [Ignavibacteria bacterium RIFOXYA12_FULL_35_25]OGU92472.1 MAG: glycosyl transferase family 2 [Ignavibacteria bacterium RIFOXYC12_FULL_35_11]OGU95849.1 MAG: glycosyl transferase family 2 [Ignavibacteria bacterium RIFOXYB12_FULL_35_14]OGV00912.1 MAG: glycosyl transferase family 2 [Ignavibacteria 